MITVLIAAVLLALAVPSFQSQIRNARLSTANNDLMVSAAGANSNVEVLYWDGLASSCPGNCMYQDGYHLRPVGANYYTALILGVLNG